MNIGTKCMQAKAQGRSDFFYDGQIWDVAELDKIKCLPKSIPAKVQASIAGSTPQARATPKPVSTNPYLPLARATPSEFRKEVEALMQTAGCTRLEAARLLSQAAGLSEQKRTSGQSYFDRVREQYKRR